MQSSFPDIREIGIRSCSAMLLAVKSRPRCRHSIRSAATTLNTHSCSQRSSILRNKSTHALEIRFNLSTRAIASGRLALRMRVNRRRQN
jgi:hypothetical protein